MNLQKKSTSCPPPPDSPLSLSHRETFLSRISDLPRRFKYASSPWYRALHFVFSALNRLGKRQANSHTAPWNSSLLCLRQACRFALMLGLPMCLILALLSSLPATFTRKVNTSSLSRRHVPASLPRNAADKIVPQTRTQIGGYRRTALAPVPFGGLIDSTTQRDLSPASAQPAPGLHTGGESLFGSVVFARYRLSLDANVQTDSYDSDRGDYDPANRGTKGNVGVSSTRHIQPSALIYPGCLINGDIVIGRPGNIEQDLILGHSARIFGRIVQTASNDDYLLIFPPWGLPLCNSLALSAGDVLTVSRSGVFPSVAITGGSRLIVNSDVDIYVRGTLSVTGNSRLIIAPTVNKVHIYAESNVLVEHGSAVLNLVRRPPVLSIWGLDSCPQIDISPQEPFHGTIYAPCSDVNIGDGVTFFGAVYGRRVHISRNAFLHYDEALTRVPPSSGTFLAASAQEI